MRKTRRFPQSMRPTLSAGTIAVLLGGWTAPAPADDEDKFQVFCIDLAEAWRTHRPMLMAEAKRRGIEAPWGLTEFEKGTDAA